MLVSKIKGMSMWATKSEMMLIFHRDGIKFTLFEDMPFSELECTRVGGCKFYSIVFLLKIDQSGSP